MAKTKHPSKSRKRSRVAKSATKRKRATTSTKARATPLRRSRPSQAAYQALLAELGHPGPIFATGARPGLHVRDEVAPALDPSLRELAAELDADPAGTMAIVHRTRPDVSEEDLRVATASLLAAIDHPEAALALMRSARARLEASRRKTWTPAPGSTFYEDIGYDANSHKFETLGDLWGWVGNCAGWWLKQKFGTLKEAPLPPHGPGKTFRYEMKDHSGKPIGSTTARIALFSDFATGLYHSRHIARHMAKAAPHYAIHLGDVYYSGIDDEVSSFLAGPLADVCNVSRTFVLNGNHEMLSGGWAYFRYIHTKHAADPARQEQESSYFSLFSERYVVIGIDTAHDWRNDGKYQVDELTTWLAGELRDAKAGADPRTTILLSQHEPFGLGKRRPNPLFEQIRKLSTGPGGSSLIDYWFWGDEHYCAHWDFRPKGTAYGFHGFCIGNGGYPVEKTLLDFERLGNASSSVFAHASWVDTTPKFPTTAGSYDPRRDLYANGYCMLDLASEGLSIRFYDWLNREVKRFP